MKKRKFEEILHEIPELSHDQRTCLEHELHHFDVKTHLCDLFEKRVEQNPSCLYCDSPDLIKNGFSSGLRRYRCKSCGKSFNALTGTPLAGLRKKELWFAFAECMLEAYSVRKTAKKIGVNLKTAFLWRHRFLALSHSHESKHFSGIIEADDTYFRKSQKGSKKLNRPPRKRGEPAPKRGVSKEYVSVLVVCDRSGAEADFITGVGAVKKSWLNKYLIQYLSKDCVFVSDKASSFNYFCKDQNLKHKTVVSKRGERVSSGVYHIQHVNSYHSRLKQWLKPFHGVATKYLNHYLGWFHELAKMKLSPLELILSAFILKTQLNGT